MAIARYEGKFFLRFGYFKLKDDLPEEEKKDLILKTKIVFDLSEDGTFIEEDPDGRIEFVHLSGFVGSDKYTMKEFVKKHIDKFECLAVYIYCFDAGSPAFTVEYFLNDPHPDLNLGARPLQEARERPQDRSS